MTTNDTDDGSSIDVASTKAHVAVGLLADATGPDTYRERDVAEAIDHLHAAREAAPEGTDTAARVGTALEQLKRAAGQAHDQKQHLVHSALGELAPVAAGIADREIEGAESRPESEKPAVAVFRDVPPVAADRAIQRFERRRAEEPVPESRVYLSNYIYDEIDERPVITVGGEMLAEYAGGRVDGFVIEPGAAAGLDED